MSEYLMTTDAVVISGPTEWDETQGPRPLVDAASFARALQTVRNGIATLNANEGDVGELVETGEGECGYSIAPWAIGQLLMACLPIEPDARLSPDAKAYWVRVAAHMGPDWIASLRKVAAFMDKVDQF